MPDEQARLTFATRDEYQRKPVAEKIIRLLESGAKVSPLVIDGSWGAGKTEFCRKLIHLIEDGDANLQPIYVDAFRADHADEPLMTLMAAVLKVFPEAKRTPLIKKAIPAIRFGVKTALKAGVSWALKQDAADIAEGFEDEVKTAGDELINHSVESLLKDHIAAEQNIATLQSALAELAAEKPLVIFIDELDRCRPDFAVNVIETVKHVFDVEGVQFVLVANFEQLRSSINHCYGAGVDAQRYLDKFVQFSLRLSDTHKPNGYEAVQASVSHLRNLIVTSELLNNKSMKSEGVDSFLTSLVVANRLSLREVETLALYLEIYQTLTDGKGVAENTILGYCLLRIFGVYLYCFEPELAENIGRNIVKDTEIAKVLGKSDLIRNLDNEYPDCDDTILAIFVLGSVRSDGRFSLSEEEREKWKRAIATYFRSGFSGRQNDHYKIAAEAIEAMKLSG